VIFRSPHPEVTIPPVSLPDLILGRARQFGDKPALVDGPSGRTYTFASFDESVRRVAEGLASSGMKKGDVLALLAPNSPEYGIMFLATALAGGVNTTLNPAATPTEVEAQIRDSGTRFAFTTPELYGKLPRDPGLRRRTIVFDSGAFGSGVIEPGERATPGGRAHSGPSGFEDLLRSAHRKDRPVTIAPDTDIVVMPYSSGTTGVPKGVQLTHRNVVANLLQTSEGIFSGDYTILGLVPFFHIYGLTVVLYLGLYLGATDVTLPRFDLPMFLDVVERYRVSHANLVPPLILMLCRHQGLDPRRLASLRSVQSGAAPLAGETASRFVERFGCSLTQGYGLSEASPVTHFAPRGGKEISVESIGPPVAGTECRIVDLETGAELGPGERGELHVRGPQVMSGYLNAREKTAEMIDSRGWLHTGDVAIADAAGNFFIVDRAKELIKYKGYAVAPAELEALLLTHPGVRDAAVVPSPDESAGEIPKAFVVRCGELEASQLISWVAERVAPQKKIRRVEFVEEIPKSASGKILRRLLVARAEATAATGSPEAKAHIPGSGALPPA
jgi:acyl-CoA synthetase (AMP-forming)/AMP-acid ligase II